jgi:hypothetical protein
LEGQRRLMPPAGSFDRQAGQGHREGLVSFLGAPSRVVRGAVEGGAQAINPDFQMPNFSDAQMPSFEEYLTSMGGGQGNEMLLPRSFDPGTDALLRAYMRQMQGGE